MANKLTDLTVKEVSFCKQGAAPGAKIAIYKSAEPELEDKETEQSLVQKVLSAVSKTFGLTPKAEGSETVEKGLFSEKWASKELKSSFYDCFWTLDDVVWDILQDPDVTDKSTKIKEAIMEFAAVTVQNIPDDPLVIAKCLQVRESLVLPARSQIEKALAPEEHKSNTVSKEEDNEMSMTPEERAALIADVTKAVTDNLGLADIVKAAVEAGVKPIQDDVAKSHEFIEAIGKMAGVSQALPPSQPNTEPVVKTANLWDNVI